MLLVSTTPPGSGLRPIPAKLIETRIRMQLLILATAVMAPLGAALAAAAGILSLMFRLMSRVSLASSDVQAGPRG